MASIWLGRFLKVLTLSPVVGFQMQIDLSKLTDTPSKLGKDGLPHSQVTIPSRELTLIFLTKLFEQFGKH